MHARRLLRWSIAGLLWAAASVPGAAEACGGTFCDSGPNAMPVDQTGENILFVLDGKNVEAHVQIQYRGSAERFAWIVPMPEIPEVEVGSQPLFTSLLLATVPSYGFSTQPDQCGNQLGAGGSAISGGAGGGFSMDAGSGGGPQVVFKKTVGAFEVTVLQGGTADEVSSWLGANGYQSIPSAPAILADYVAKNFVFVAVKLTGGADVDEIHPLVFRYPGNEPCVPLKLTAVAATEDMGVRAFFLGDDRVYPAPGYMHVTLNPARIDWLSLATNYNQVVSRAADSDVANGRAFVTEYAGPSAAVGLGGVYSAAWSEAPFASIAPEDVITELQNQGLASCFPECVFNHPLVLPLLEQYLPAPAGLTANEFYANLPGYVAQIDLTKWSAVGFATDFKARIVDPGKHARDMLARWPYLTRLYTTISPAEMTLDPEFVARPDLSAEVTPQSLGTLRVACDGKRGMTLPDGREVAVGASWPPFSSKMPWVERIEEVPASGAPVVLVDNAELIDRELALWNDSQGWPPPGSGGAGGTLGSGGNSAGEDDSTIASNASGCGCSTPGGTSGAGLAFGLGALAVAHLRRRRRLTDSARRLRGR